MSNATDIPTKADAEHQSMDAAEIALRVGVSASLVRKVLNGTRRNDKVVRAYNALLKERAKAQKQFQAIQKGTQQ
ncbi:hypothetical protein QMK33_00430 [Hymenobacter sp. H14-R3]|uniref:hypothetical protein n=1 Tax=Hymenobacter sp. H14-R3 TaxID=3046308 RepID=UPI0024BB9C51|nr:hypothetical protein [Hymenobacter sp. H14-R3]MDJ0363600.1 hypothetical protein [Hymenobacter sp. H14-R3]